jgi:radical SAM superfamily enzyme YgiQ (UPF0313 family)
MHILLFEFNPFQPEHTPISLGYMAAHAKACGFPTDILNVGSNTRISTAGFARYLQEKRPQLIGFSAYQRNIFLVKGWAQFCKQVLPETKVLIGGPQATFMPTEALRSLPPIDLICRSEGEDALVEAARRLSEDQPLLDVPGWSGRGVDNEFWDGPPIVLRENLDDYPSPYLDGTLDPGGMDEAILLASRGCPYKCAFCYTPKAFGKRIRYHSLDRVMEELQWIRRHGLQSFWFADPSFTFEADRIHSLFDALLRKRLDMHIWLETRFDLVDEELVRLMKGVGVHTVAYGLESAADHVRKRIGKPLNQEQVVRAIRITQKAGLEVELFSQFALPGETLEDAQATLSFVRDNAVKVRGNTNAQQMQVYFGTQIQQESERFGIRTFEEPIPVYLSTGSRYETEWMKTSEIEEMGRRWKAASEDGGKHIVS